MRRMLATTALALLLSAPAAITLHAQTGGGGGGSDTTGGASGPGAGDDAGSSTATGTESGNETGGTTGAMTTTPEAKTDDALGTRGTAAADWGSTTGGDLVGRTVYGSNGEEIGEVQDIVSRSGGAPEALVGVGGFLGIGERDVAIPLSSLRMEGDRLTTTMTKANIEAMQPYDQSGYTPWERTRAVGQ